MIFELASIRVLAGYESAFEEKVAQAWEILLEDPSCHSVELLRSIEVPREFRLRVGWDSVAAHEHFRTGDGFKRWRELVGSILDGAPTVEHAQLVLSAIR